MRHRLLLGASWIAVACTAPAAPDAPGTVRTAAAGGAVSTLTLDPRLDGLERRTVGFVAHGVWFSSDLAGGRLSDVWLDGDTLFVARIRPENTPINASAWYAFKVWSDVPRTIAVRLTYDDGRHRYWPKVRARDRPWAPMSDDAVQLDSAGHTATVRLRVGPDTLWVAGQPLITSVDFRHWTDGLARLPHVSREEIGRSRLGRAIDMLTITDAPAADRHVLLISRQHPPEVTGTLALVRFVEEIIGDSPLAREFRRHFQVRVVPLVNPDGVDLGHWRHNTGGVDLNRDWAEFRQPETRAVRDALLRVREQPGAAVWFAADFHSTRRDLFYTLDRAFETDPPGFFDRWLDRIRADLPDYHLSDSATGLRSPTSRNWFYREFGAPSLTYEVGDATDPALIRTVATTAARAMMELLLVERLRDSVSTEGGAARFRPGAATQD